jgi:uncharacterized membrane protein YkoI
MTRRRTLATLLAVLLAGPTFAPPALADDKEHKRRRPKSNEGDIDQDEILEALKRQEIRPLPEILAAAEAVMPGQVVGVKVKRLSEKRVYELKIIGPQGRVREIYVDAASLAIVKIE